MNILVAGATGAVGRRLVPMLVTEGHKVFAISRSPQRLAHLQHPDVQPLRCDVLDAAAVEATVTAVEAEVVIDELTDLPAALKPRGLKAAYERNNRVRREGGGNLLAAATKIGVRRLVLQSAAFWYAPGGSNLKTEDDPFFLDAAEPVGEAVRTMKQVEQRAFDSGLEVVVLRYGLFYGPGTWYSPDGDVGRRVASRMYPMVGDGTGVFSFIHVDDAATATVKAVSGPPGIYNIVDDDPAPVAEWLPAFADELGARPPLRAPVGVARVAAGMGAVEWMTKVPGAANSRAKKELGWSPARPSWRAGFTT